MKATVSFAKQASSVGELAGQLLEEHVSTQEKVAAAVPVLIEKLKSSNLITAGQIKNAEALLGDHAGSLDLLQDLLDHHVTLQKENETLRKSAASSLGSPSPTQKSGSAKPQDVYARADAAYRERLGLPVR